MRETDAPYIFTEGFRKFPDNRGFEQIDHVDGHGDTCDWALAAEQDKLIECGFPGIAPVTCESFGCCFDKTGPVTLESNCYVGTQSNQNTLKLYDQKLPKARPTAISFDGATENSYLDIKDEKFLTNGDWTVAFCLMITDRGIAMDKPANVLTLTNTGSGD